MGEAYTLSSRSLGRQVERCARVRSAVVVCHRALCLPERLDGSAHTGQLQLWRLAAIATAGHRFWLVPLLPRVGVALTIAAILALAFMCAGRRERMLGGDCPPLGSEACFPNSTRCPRRCGKRRSASKHDGRQGVEAGLLVAFLEAGAL